MAARQAAIDSIFGEFYTEWVANAPAPTPVIAWQDVPFDPPDDCASWARVSVRHSDSDIASLGGVGARKWRTEGRVWVQIFTKLGVGRNASDGLVEVAIDVFRGKKVGISPVVRFWDIKPIEIGPEGPWFQQDVSVHFWYDEVV
jgi:hypothetical protein